MAADEIILKLGLLFNTTTASGVYGNFTLTLMLFSFFIIPISVEVLNKNLCKGTYISGTSSYEDMSHCFTDAHVTSGNRFKSSLV